MPLNTEKTGDTRAPTTDKPISDLFHNEVTAWLVLALSLTITGLGWFLASEAIEKRAAERFKFEVREAQERIENRMKQYEQVLRGGVALFESSEEVTRAEWHVYANSLALEKALPGLLGFAYAPKVSANALEAHQTAVRAEGFPDYRVAPAGAREVFFPITLIEPFDARNQRAFGFDMYSERVRKRAMDTAIETGQPTLSGLVKLKQEDGENVQPGFLIYLPVYSAGAALDTPKARREAIRGIVYSPFRAVDLMRNITGKEKLPLSFQLFDSADMHPETLIYNSAEGQPELVSKHSLTVPITLSGRTWMAHFQSTDNFDQQVGSATPNLILVAGVVIDVLLFLVLCSLAAQRKRLSASHAKNLFLANMSHEIRTPLNAIVGLNNLLKEHVKEPPAAQYVAQVEDASQYLLAMLEDVLSFSQIESGLIKLEKIEFDLHAQATKTVRQFELRARQQGLHIELEVDVMTPLMVKGDPTRYTQVLGNLLSNAIKFSERGPIRVTVQADQVDEQDVTVRTEVQDRGIGFDPDEFDRLTEPFEQADNTTTRRFGGTGLGLAISKRLSGLMGGQLYVNSSSSEGSLLGFTMSVKPVYGHAGQADPPPPMPSLAGKKILVVEDNLLNQHVIKTLLAGMKVQVILAENGAQAVNAVQLNPELDLVLMDIHMPIMNGIDATRAIRELAGPSARIPIVALTACALQEDEAECRQAGVDEFLTKPVNVPVLQQVLSRFLLPPG